MKIFAMNDCDWVAAENIDQAKDCYLTFIGLDAEEAFFDGEPEELSNEDMDRLMFNYTDEPGRDPVTFRERLRELIESGQKFPQFFASTEY